MRFIDMKKPSVSSLFFVLLYFLVLGSALADQAPSGYIEFQDKEFRLILGGQGGKGTLHFQGKTYPFKLSGVSVGGIGYSEVKAHGEVYGLHKVADFPGSYLVLSAGVAAVKGKSGSWYKNDKGVSLHVTSHQKGVALDLGVGGIQIDLVK